MSIDDIEGLRDRASHATSEALVFLEGWQGRLADHGPLIKLAVTRSDLDKRDYN